VPAQSLDDDLFSVVVPVFNELETVPELQRRLAAALAVAIQPAPFASALLYSIDACTYWAIGRVAAVHGGNPNVNPPSDRPDDPAYELMGAQWRDDTATYRPLRVTTSEGVARVANESGDRASWLFKAVAGVGSVSQTLAAVAASTRGRRTFARTRWLESGAGAGVRRRRA